ncbi:hypothetical protein ACJX0J_020140, partial [Zea mays]
QFWAIFHLFLHQKCISIHFTLLTGTLRLLNPGFVVPTLCHSCKFPYSLYRAYALEGSTICLHGEKWQAISKSLDSLYFIFIVGLSTFPPLCHLHTNFYCTFYTFNTI